MTERRGDLIPIEDIPPDQAETIENLVKNIIIGIGYSLLSEEDKKKVAYKPDHIRIPLTLSLLTDVQRLYLRQQVIQQAFLHHRIVLQ